MQNDNKHRVNSEIETEGEGEGEGDREIQADIERERESERERSWKQRNFGRADQVRRHVKNQKSQVK